MSNPKVSVILPVYNTAPYLKDSVGSICKQTLADIEIIIVNDGSTDESGSILKKMAEDDSRIRYYEQENRGLSCARNTGMKYAKGDYIYFMDSDDAINIDALEKCYGRCSSQNLDFVFFDGDIVREGKNDNVCWDYHRTSKYDDSVVYEGNWLMNDMLDNFTHRSVVWLLFIKHIYIKEKNFSFYPGIIHEDELYTVMLILESERIGCIKDNLVKHRVRSNSIMAKQYSLRNVSCYLTVVDELMKYSMTKSVVVKSIINKYSKYTLDKVFYTAHVLNFKDKIKSLLRLLNSRYAKFVSCKTILLFLIK